MRTETSTRPSNMPSQNFLPNASARGRPYSPGERLSIRDMIQAQPNTRKKLIVSRGKTWEGDWRLKPDGWKNLIAGSIAEPSR